MAIPDPNNGGSRRRPAFTLIEVLVVIVVISVLAAIVGPEVFRHVDTANEAAARTQIESLGAALDSYRLDNGRYPTTAQGLDALREIPTADPRPTNWRGPYLTREVPLDPWDAPYVYVSPGAMNTHSYDLMSLGGDGQMGGEGVDADITNWD